MRKERKHFTPEEKVAILRRHLVGQSTRSPRFRDESLHLGMRAAVDQIL